MGWKGCSGWLFWFFLGLWLVLHEVVIPFRLGLGGVVLHPLEVLLVLVVDCLVFGNLVKHFQGVFQEFSHILNVGSGCELVVLTFPNVVDVLGEGSFRGLAFQETSLVEHAPNVDGVFLAESRIVVVLAINEGLVIVHVLVLRWVVHGVVRNRMLNLVLDAGLKHPPELVEEGFALDVLVQVRGNFLGKEVVQGLHVGDSGQVLGSKEDFHLGSFESSGSYLRDLALLPCGLLVSFWWFGGSIL